MKKIYNSAVLTVINVKEDIITSSPGAFRASSLGLGHSEGNVLSDAEDGDIIW